MYDPRSSLDAQIFEARQRAELFSKSLQEARQQELSVSKILDQERRKWNESYEEKNLLIAQLERELSSTVEALDGTHRANTRPFNGIEPAKELDVDVTMHKIMEDVNRNLPKFIHHEKVSHQSFRMHNADESFVSKMGTTNQDPWVHQNPAPSTNDTVSFWKELVHQYREQIHGLKKEMNEASKEIENLQAEGNNLKKNVVRLEEEKQLHIAAIKNSEGKLKFRVTQIMDAEEEKRLLAKQLGEVTQVNSQLQKELQASNHFRLQRTSSADPATECTSRESASPLTHEQHGRSVPSVPPTVTADDHPAFVSRFAMSVVNPNKENKSDVSIPRNEESGMGGVFHLGGFVSVADHEGIISDLKSRLNHSEAYSRDLHSQLTDLSTSYECQLSEAKKVATSLQLLLKDTERRRDEFQLRCGTAEQQTKQFRVERDALLAVVSQFYNHQHLIPVNVAPHVSFNTTADPVLPMSTATESSSNAPKAESKDEKSVVLPENPRSEDPAKQMVNILFDDSLLSIGDVHLPGNDDDNVAMEHSADLIESQPEAESILFTPSGEEHQQLRLRQHHLETSRLLSLAKSNSAEGKGETPKSEKSASSRKAIATGKNVVKPVPVSAPANETSSIPRSSSLVIRHPPQYTGLSAEAMHALKGAKLTESERTQWESGKVTSSSSGKKGVSRVKKTSGKPVASGTSGAKKAKASQSAKKTTKHDQKTLIEDKKAEKQCAEMDEDEVDEGDDQLSAVECEHLQALGLGHRDSLEEAFQAWSSGATTEAVLPLPPPLHEDTVAFSSLGGVVTSSEQLPVPPPVLQILPERSDTEPTHSLLTDRSVTMPSVRISRNGELLAVESSMDSAVMSASIAASSVGSRVSSVKDKPKKAKSEGNKQGKGGKIGGTSKSPYGTLTSAILSAKKPPSGKRNNASTKASSTSGAPQSSVPRSYSLSSAFTTPQSRK